MMFNDFIDLGDVATATAQRTGFYDAEIWVTGQGLIIRDSGGKRLDERHMEHFEEMGWITVKPNGSWLRITMTPEGLAEYERMKV